MMLRCCSLVLAVAILAFGCSKKEEGKPGEAAGQPVAKTEAPKASGPFAAWDMGGLTQKWQGAWMMVGGSIGTWEAWNVQGDKVTVWDGKAEKTLDFAVTSPCTVKTTEKSQGGSSSSVTHFTFKGESLLAGLGDAGSKKGSEAVACVSNFVVTLDAAGKCTKWEPSMFDDGKWEAKEGVCKWAKDGEKDVLSVTGQGSHETKLPVLGDALATDQLGANPAQKFADFAAAKAARDAKK